MLRSGALALSIVLFAGVASAADAPPGSTALRQARVAWDRGTLETAEPLYREALEKGGLAPPDVLEGYVRLGAIRAALGKKDAALAAFRAASVLDENFAVPSEGGAKAANLAEKAKHDTAKIGTIKLGVQVPKDAPPGKALKVTATLDKGHMPIVNKIALVAKDGTTGKDVELDAKPDESVDFEISSDLALPNASIVVRIDALDAHQNRLASTEKTVKVSDKDDGPKVVSGGTANGTAAGSSNKANGADPGSTKHGGGFWSTPWPYVVGGLAIIGAAVAVYYGVRPTAPVSVGQPSVTQDGSQ